MALIFFYYSSDLNDLEIVINEEFPFFLNIELPINSQIICL